MIDKVIVDRLCQTRRVAITRASGMVYIASETESKKLYETARWSCEACPELAQSLWRVELINVSRAAARKGLIISVQCPPTSACVGKIEFLIGGISRALPARALYNLITLYRTNQAVSLDSLASNINNIKHQRHVNAGEFSPQAWRAVWSRLLGAGAPGYWVAQRAVSAASWRARGRK